jgi:ABC-2 type transport system permease protein
LGGNVRFLDGLLFVGMLLAGVIIVYSFWIILATTAFWIVRADNIFQIFNALFVAGRWPVTIYPNWLRVILTFIVPVAFAVTVPAQGLIGRLDPTNTLLAIGVAAGLLLIARLFWRWGLVSYSGASA